MSINTGNHNTNFGIQFRINIEVYEESVPQTKKIPHRAVEFQAGEENRILKDSLNSKYGSVSVKVLAGILIDA